MGHPVRIALTRNGLLIKLIVSQHAWRRCDVTNIVVGNGPDKAVCISFDIKNTQQRKALILLHLLGMNSWSDCALKS